MLGCCWWNCCSSETLLLVSIALMFQCCFLQRARNTEQTACPRVFLTGAHYSAESTEARQIKCLALGHDILMQPRIGPSISVYRNCILTFAADLP